MTRFKAKPGMARFNLMNGTHALPLKTSPVQIKVRTWKI